MFKQKPMQINQTVFSFSLYFINCFIPPCFFLRRKKRQLWDCVTDVSSIYHNQLCHVTLIKPMSSPSSFGFKSLLPALQHSFVANDCQLIMRWKWENYRNKSERNRKMTTPSERKQICRLNKNWKPVSKYSLTECQTFSVCFNQFNFSSGYVCVPLQPACRWQPNLEAGVSVARRSCK